MEHLPMAGVAEKVDHKRGQAHETAMFHFFSISVVQWWDHKDFRLTDWLIHWLIGTGSCFSPDCSSNLPVSASQKLGLQDGAITPASLVVFLGIWVWPESWASLWGQLSSERDRSQTEKPCLMWAARCQQQLTCQRRSCFSFYCPARSRLGAWKRID